MKTSLNVRNANCSSRHFHASNTNRAWNSLYFFILFFGGRSGRDRKVCIVHIVLSSVRDVSSHTPYAVPQNYETKVFLFVLPIAKLTQHDTQWCFPAIHLDQVCIPPYKMYLMAINYSLSWCPAVRACCPVPCWFDFSPCAGLCWVSPGCFMFSSEMWKQHLKDVQYVETEGKQ